MLFNNMMKRKDYGYSTRQGHVVRVGKVTQEQAAWRENLWACQKDSKLLKTEVVCCLYCNYEPEEWTICNMGCADNCLFTLYYTIFWVSGLAGLFYFYF